MNLEGAPVSRLGGWGQRGGTGWWWGGPHSCRSQGCRGRSRRGQGGDSLPESAAPARVSLGAPPGLWDQSSGSGRRAAGAPRSPGPESSGLGHSPESAPGPAGEAEAQGPESGGGACVGGQGLSLGAQGQQGWSRAHQGGDAQEGRSPAQKDALLLWEVSEPPRNRAQTPWACGTTSGGTVTFPRVSRQCQDGGFLGAQGPACPQGPGHSAP